MCYARSATLHEPIVTLELSSMAKGVQFYHFVNFLYMDEHHCEQTNDKTCKTFVLHGFFSGLLDNDYNTTYLTNIVEK